MSLLRRVARDCLAPPASKYNKIFLLHAAFLRVLHGLKGAHVGALGARLLPCALSSLVLTVIERSFLAQRIELVHD